MEDLPHLPNKKAEMSNTQFRHRIVAEQWPRGSVVLVRVKQASPLFHAYTYFLSTYFTTEAMSHDPAHEYALIEEPNRKETNANTETMASQ